VQYFKGKFHACGGDAFDRRVAGTPREAFLEAPRAWADASTAERGWFALCNGTQAWGDGDAETTRPCCDEWPASRRLVPTSKQVCACFDAAWVDTVPQAFDSIVTAVAGLFEMATTEGWMEVNWALVDATDVDMQPVRDHAPLWAVFMLFYMLVSSFFFMNLFVGVLYERFTKMQKELKGRSSFLTPKQYDLLETQRLGLSFKPKRKARALPGHFGQVGKRTGNLASLACTNAVCRRPCARPPSLRFRSCTTPRSSWLSRAASR
jgi:hypothetical protein